MRPLSEAECYARCYPGWDESVRVLDPEPRPAAGRPRPGVSGEELRRSFERRLGRREEEAA